jgi:hypothetical protein
VTTSSHPEVPEGTVARRQPDPGPAMSYAPEYQRRLWGTCAALARADWLPEGVRGRAGNIFAVALLGEQFKLDAMPAVLNIHIIESQNGTKKSVVLSAQLWIKLARDAGHKVRAKKGHPTEDECTVYLWRGDEDDEEPYEATYTMSQARRAGLVRAGSNYERSPEDMLFARAAVRVIRRAAGEVALANAVDEYEAEAMSYDEPPPARQPNLAEAAAARETKPGSEPVDAEVVPEPTGPTAEQLADLERQHAPGPDLDGGVVPTPEEVDERRIAGEGGPRAVDNMNYDDPADDAGGGGLGAGRECPHCDELIPNGTEHDCERDTARPPRASDWSDDDVCPGCGSTGPEHDDGCTAGGVTPDAVPEPAPAAQEEPPPWPDVTRPPEPPREPEESPARAARRRGPRRQR